MKLELNGDLVIEKKDIANMTDEEFYRFWRAIGKSIKRQCVSKVQREV